MAWKQSDVWKDVRGDNERHAREGMDASATPEQRCAWREKGWSTWAITNEENREGIANEVHPTWWYHALLLKSTSTSPSRLEAHTLRMGRMVECKTHRLTTPNALRRKGVNDGPLQPHGLQSSMFLFLLESRVLEWLLPLKKSRTQWGEVIGVHALLLSKLLVKANLTTSPFNQTCKLSLRKLCRSSYLQRYPLFHNR